MKNLLFTLIAVFIFSSTIFAQHPNTFLKDVYDLEWCQKMKIKTIQSGGDNYTLTSGVPISESAKDVITRMDGALITLSQGHGKFHITYRLSSDLKYLESTMMGAVGSYYFYNNENQLKYKVNHVNVRPKDQAFIEAFSIEEMTRNASGQLVKKEIYNYKEPIIDFKNNLEKMQSMDRKLKANWDYKYNQEDELVEIVIKHYSLTDESDSAEGVNTIKIEYENSLPIALKIESSGKTPPVMSNQRKFLYSF